MSPDPTRTYFWPAVNKRQTPLWPEYFSTRPDDIFLEPFDPKGKKLKNLTFLGEIHTQSKDGWPNLTRLEQQKFYPTRVKIFDPDPSLMRWLAFLPTFTWNLVWSSLWTQGTDDVSLIFFLWPRDLELQPMPTFTRQICLPGLASLIFKVDTWNLVSCFLLA